jgi:hypothetical protein
MTSWLTCAALKYKVQHAYSIFMWYIICHKSVKQYRPDLNNGLVAPINYVDLDVHCNACRSVHIKSIDRSYD